MVKHFSGPRIFRNLNTAFNMPEYGFFLTRFCPYTEKYGSVKIRNLVHFTQWHLLTVLHADVTIA